jgi:hypothetical protein
MLNSYKTESSVTEVTLAPFRAQQGASFSSFWKGMLINLLL